MEHFSGTLKESKNFGPVLSPIKQSIVLIFEHRMGPFTVEQYNKIHLSLN